MVYPREPRLLRPPHGQTKQSLHSLSWTCQFLCGFYIHRLFTWGLSETYTFREDSGSELRKTERAQNPLWSIRWATDAWAASTDTERETALGAKHIPV